MLIKLFKIFGNFFRNALCIVMKNFNAMRIFTAPGFVLALILLAISSFQALIAQTGPGGVGNQTNNALWLRADAIVSANNQPINEWRDQSGNGNDVRQAIPAQQPLFINNFMNGYPVVRFDNNNTAGQNDFMWGDDDDSLDDTNGLTIFSVVRRSTGGSARSIVSKRVNFAAPNYSYMFFFFSGNRLYADIVTNNNRFNTTQNFNPNNNFLISLHYDGTLPQAQRSRIYREENLLITASEFSTSIPNNASPIVIGATHIGDNRSFGGDMAEIIIYRKALNNTERIIVNNYLSAKYDIPLTANDVYRMDDTANDDFDHEVAGIGRLSATDLHDDSRGTGLVRIFNPTDLNDDEFLMWGHNNQIVEAFEFDDVPTDVEARFERVWRASEISTTGAVVDVGAIDIQFDLNGLGPVTASDLRLLVDTDNDGNFDDETPIAGAIDVGGGIYQFSGVTAIADGRRFTIGTINAQITPLPVEFLTFEGTCNEGRPKLLWSTAMEKENDYFEIQQSSDGRNWETVGMVKGAGFSDQVLEYSFSDLNPFNGMAYFRIKQVDYDGTYDFSRVIMVNCGNRFENKVVVSPNPSAGRVNINLMGAEGDVSIIDAQGKAHVIYMHIKGRGEVDLSHLPNGIYFVHTKLNNAVVTRKLVLMK